MINIVDLTYRYNRKKTLFEGLNLDLVPGKVYGLLGKNGAGKSSLIKNMAGLLLPSRGSCKINEEESSERNTRFYENLFFLPEETELPNLSVPEFMKIYGPFYPAFDEQQFLLNLGVFQVDPASHLRQLSFGQRKKTYIAFALATNTPVLIMDEPTNGLDIPSKLQFRKMVAEANRKDKITIMSTHQVRDLDDLINTILIMDDSRILLHADKQEILNRLYFTQEKTADALYSEETATGSVSIIRNISRRSSYLDLEVLFNSVLKGGDWVAKQFGHCDLIQDPAPTLPANELPLSPKGQTKGLAGNFYSLLKREYIENKKLYRVAAMAMAGILLFLFFVTWHFRNSFLGGTNQGIFLVGLLFGGSLFISTFLKDLHQPSKATWLMALPASIHQKLLIVIIYGIFFYLIAFISIFFLSQGIFNRIAGEHSVRMEFSQLWKNSFHNFLFTFINLQLLVLLGSLAFSRAAFIKTIILILTFFLLGNTLNNNLLALITGESSINGGGLFDYFQFVHNNENVYINLPANLQFSLNIIFHFLVPVFLYYIISLKFRETEI